MNSFACLYGKRIFHAVLAANVLMMSVSGYLSYVDSLPMRAPAGLFGLPAAADHDRAWAHAESALQVWISDHTRSTVCSKIAS
jgi:hypothetical protein